MTIYGVSQSIGLERRLNVERGVDGVVLIITDHRANVERERILVSIDDLVAAITDPVAGGSVVEGVSPPQGAKMNLDVEVRRNEVLLVVRSGSDVAVGLDDFQDALEGILSRG